MPTKPNPWRCPRTPKCPTGSGIYSFPLEAQALRFDFSSPARRGEAGLNFMVGEFSGFNN